MKKPHVLLSIGLLWISGTLMISHYITIPDFVMGISMGIGIGLEMLPLVKKMKFSG